ncbi:MAG: hypothetical protein R2797_08765 [Gelidibacter sp.]
MGLLVLTSCSKSNSDDDGGTPQDISELIIGKWIPTSIPCNAGYTFNENLTWSWGNFEGCDDECFYLPYGSTYTIMDDVLIAVDAMSEGDGPKGRVEISEDNVFTLYDLETDEVILVMQKSNGC